MVLPRKVFHKTSIQVPDQDDFDHKLKNTQALPLQKNTNLTHEGIVIKIIPISAILVLYGFDTDLDYIIIYRRIKNRDNLDTPAIHALLTYLSG